MDRPIASAIANIDHLSVFDKVCEHRFAALDLTVLLLGMFDTAPETVLPYLAEQYHILGVEGWSMADTVDQRRALLKKAIELHRRKGTPWSVKQAILALGFDSVDILEGIDRFHNGVIHYDGQDTHGSSGWARFIVTITLGAIPYSSNIQQKVLQLIEEYKPARSTLLELRFI